MRHWATCYVPTAGECFGTCGCPCHRSSAPLYDWETEVDPDPVGVPAGWWAIGAVASCIAGAVDRVARLRRPYAPWWWPWARWWR